MYDMTASPYENLIIIFYSTILIYSLISEPVVIGQIENGTFVLTDLVGVRVKDKAISTEPMKSLEILNRNRINAVSTTYSRSYAPDYVRVLFLKLNMPTTPSYTIIRTRGL